MNAYEAVLVGLIFLFVFGISWCSYWWGRRDGLQMGLEALQRIQDGFESVAAVVCPEKDTPA